MPEQYDAVVVGAGPNGLTAACVLQRAGLSVLLVERAPTVGGSLRSGELTEPGFVHDIGASAFPMAYSSPAFRALRLAEDHGVSWSQPEHALAHPMDDGPASVLSGSVQATAERLTDAADRRAYEKLMGPVAKSFARLLPELLQPVHVVGPTLAPAMVRFGLRAMRSVSGLARSRFRSEQGQAAWAGHGAHSVLPLDWAFSSAPAVALTAAAHDGGWPMATSGAQRIGDALRACFEAAGGTVQTGRHVASVDELPTHRALLLDLPPRRVAELCGDRLPGAYRRKLERYVHGPGAFKVDWALREPIPWTDPACRGAGTVHVGGTLEQIAEGEAAAWEGRHVDRPFVLLVQPSVADPSRAPEGRHTAWGYCHVPNGSTVDMTDAIESQVERFAPGFRDVVLARHTMHTADFEQWNPNLIGGDIVGGAAKLSQLFTRPVPRWCPYSTPDRSIYLCSASTPPGAGVHGMCGHHAALAVLRRRFPELDIEGAANERE